MEKTQIIELIKNKQYDKITNAMFYTLEKEMETKEIIQYNMQVEQRKKSPIIAWILWTFTGVLGGELIYLGLKGSRLIAFILIIVGWILYYFIIGGFIILGVDLWTIYLVYNALKENEIEVRAQVYEEMFMK